MNDEIYNCIFDIRYAVDQLEKSITNSDEVYELQRQLDIARDALEDIAVGTYDSGYAMDLAAEALTQLKDIS